MAHSPELLQAIKRVTEGRLDLARNALHEIWRGKGAEALAAVRFLAHVETLERRYAQAIAVLEAAGREFDGEPRILAQLAENWMQLGDYERAIECAERSLGAQPDNAVMRLNLAIWQASRSVAPLQIKSAFEAWCRQYLDAPEPPGLAPRDPRRDRKLRLGYISGDLRNHAVRYFIEPYLRGHDRARFEVHAFLTETPDAISGVLREHVEHWHDVQRLSTEELLQTIRRLEIDILVDLSGHTAGERLAVFAKRAAPVQVTWWGFVGTLGMRAMDYRLTDWVTCPPGTDAHYTERLCRMSCLTAYEPPLNCDALYASPWRRNGFVTLISLNHTRKLGDQVMRAWGEILRANPTARLSIVATESTQEGAQALLQPRLAAAGLPLDRVTIVPKLTMTEFMGLAAVADFALDSMPISGGVTTLHSLWMGLPVLAVRPAQPIALQAYSANTLRTVGLDECVAPDGAALIALANRWIAQPEHIDRVRAQCRPRLASSPFLAHAERVRELEDCLAAMWAARVAGAAPS